MFKDRGVFLSILGLLSLALIAAGVWYESRLRTDFAVTENAIGRTTAELIAALGPPYKCQKIEIDGVSPRGELHVRLPLVLQQQLAERGVVAVDEYWIDLFGPESFIFWAVDGIVVDVERFRDGMQF